MHAVFLLLLKKTNKQKKTNKGNNELIKYIHEFFFIFILREIPR